MAVILLSLQHLFSPSLDYCYDGDVVIQYNTIRGQFGQCLSHIINKVAFRCHQLSFTIINLSIDNSISNNFLYLLLKVVGETVTNFILRDNFIFLMDIFRYFIFANVFWNIYSRPKWSQIIGYNITSDRIYFLSEIKRFNFRI